ncbi:MAG TPA: sigma-54-dependent Fis family transcriptional regulator [Chloroflexi bacterium]|nr:MAG: sigma-54-dependent Fis family transcriptional regulator [Chloroflexota bacterium]HDN04697.1 sigma-54-dependent Fis family transcriptional regulator [Chloroflexota bacterium]
MTATILLVDDEKNARNNIGSYLESEGYEVLLAADLKTARKHLSAQEADIVLLDVQLPDGYGPDLLAETAQLPFRPPIIMITAHGKIDMAVEAMKNGAHDFIQKPIKFDRLEQSIKRAQDLVEMREELNHFRRSQREALDSIVINSDIMRAVFTEAQRAAKHSTSILISGETGTGKEVLARAIHRMGPRSDKPFIDINCAAVQNTMLESELFGYEAGAFTGAQKRKRGLMEVADEGILFLDEISSMSSDMQAKILRALEERSFRRVGSTTSIHIDVQILAASNKNLLELIEKGQFRQDLYYRLKVINIVIPPLREHPEDIPGLAGHFIKTNNPKMGINIENMTPAALELLKEYSWPGNIRELRNVIERAMIFCDEATLDVNHLPAELKGI